jgi:hypothetical protein
MLLVTLQKKRRMQLLPLERCLLKYHCQWYHGALVYRFVSAHDGKCNPAMRQGRPINIKQPGPDILFSFYATQPFSPPYTVLFGKGGHVVMIVLAAVALWFNTAIAVLAASRLVFAVARDGVLPFWGWVSKVSTSGQPQNAVIEGWIGCRIHNMFYSSLINCIHITHFSHWSAIRRGLRTYLLGRFCITKDKFPKPRWSLGRLSRPFQFIAIFWNS